MQIRLDGAVAGSAYTYAYASHGEIFAWIIGWDLLLEYGVGAASVAHGWSTTLQIFSAVGNPPRALIDAPFDFNPATGRFFPTGAIIDLPALLISAFLMVFLVIGIRLSATFNALMVAVKLAVVFLIVPSVFSHRPVAPLCALRLFRYRFFRKTIAGQRAAGGEARSWRGAIVFYAYIGFDSVSTHAEEARNPNRDVPSVSSPRLLLCGSVYRVAAVLTGMVPYYKIDIHAPLAHAFSRVGLPLAHFLISLGALTGITSVLMVLMLSQPRIMLAMARDGLLPASFFGSVHARFRTPWKSTVLTGIAVGLMGAFLPLRMLAELVNIGTLLAFVIVCAAVLIMRYREPDTKRPFRCPFVPLVPILGIGFCMLLMFSLPAENWFRLIVWLLLGFAIYFSYGRRHSLLGQIMQSSTEGQAT
jgi:APA family basic amino acid/polyamine antiporter